MQLRFAVIAALSTLVTPGGEAQRAPRAPVTPLAVGTWSSRGPGGGGALYSPVISSFDPDEIFLMTDMTGVFHTVDFGERWQTLDFRQIQGDPLGRVELTSDRTVLYALSARGERRVLEKSTDAGATFHAMPVSDQIGDPRYLFADPDRADTFVTADRSTIYVSRDGGSSLFAAYTSALNDRLRARRGVLRRRRDLCGSQCRTSRDARRPGRARGRFTAWNTGQRTHRLVRGRG